MLKKLTFSTLTLTNLLMKKNYVLMAWLLLGYFSVAAQAHWASSYEDKQVKIEYLLADCNDSQNGFSFQYYFLRIKNKTNRQVNVQYLLGNPGVGASEDEMTANLILKPNEILTGDCTTEGNLKFFSKDNKSDKSKSTLFSISKIKTYAL